MSEIYEEERPLSIIQLTGWQLVRVMICGALVGAATWGLTWVLNAYVFNAILCRGHMAVQCSAAPNYAAAAALVITGIAALVALVRLQVYRPLLVVLAAIVSFWGLMVPVMDLPWYWGLVSGLVLFGLAYGAFVWLARIRSFILALLLCVVVVVVIRLILTA